MNRAAARLRQSKKPRRSKGCPTWPSSSGHSVKNPPRRPTTRNSFRVPTAQAEPIVSVSGGQGRNEHGGLSCEEWAIWLDGVLACARLVFPGLLLLSDTQSIPAARSV